MPYVTKWVQTLNKPQQRALKALYDRGAIKIKVAALHGSAMAPFERQISYREFRRSVRFSFDYALVQWCGMTVGIERDGHTHS